MYWRSIVDWIGLNFQNFFFIGSLDISVLDEEIILLKLHTEWKLKRGILSKY